MPDGLDQMGDITLMALLLAKYMPRSSNDFVYRVMKYESQEVTSRIEKMYFQASWHERFKKAQSQYVEHHGLYPLRIDSTSHWSYVPLVLRPTGPTCTSLGLRASTQSRHYHKSTDSLCCQSRLLCLSELLRVSHTALFQKHFVENAQFTKSASLC